MGCPYVGFGPDITAFIESLTSPLNLNSVTGFHRLVQDSLDDQLRRLSAFVKHADRFIAASLVFGGASVARALEVPYRYIVFTPQVLPSSGHPFPLIPTQTLPGILNAASWRLSVLWDIPHTRLKLNRFARKNGLPVIKDAWKWIIGDRPILACDPQIARPPEDVPMRVTQTGYLHLDRMESMAPEMARFLSDQKQIVFSGFGSMPGRDQKRHVGTMIRVAGKSRAKIIIAASWLNRIVEQVDRDVLLVKECPHRLVFPQVNAVMHHGGAGTTATAALGGVSQIIVPHILDQYYHGHQIFRRRLGPEPVWRGAVNEHKLLRAVHQALNDTELIRNAGNAAKCIDPERSLENAVKSIESVWN